MASLSKQALQVENVNSFPNNTTNYITPAILRSFNSDIIDSTVNQGEYTTNSGSWNQQIGSLNAFTASASGLNTGSLMVTASAVNNVITFTKGNNTTFNVTVATGSIPDISNLNQATASLQAFTASAQISINNLNTTTASLNTSVSNINTFTASAAISITNLNASSASQQVSIDNLNQKTGSYATTGSNTFVGGNTFTSISASSFISASEFVGNGAKITGITASISMPILDEGIPQGNAVSLNFTGSAITATVAGGVAIISVQGLDTGSFNAYTASTNSDLAEIHQATASLQSNSASVNTSITNLNASSASQEVSINALNTNSASVNTSISALNTFTASQSTASLVTSINNLNTFSASALVSISNLNTNSASVNTSITNVNSATASLFTSVNNINSATSSLYTSASLAITTASAVGNTITFTKGDSTTFNVSVTAAALDTASLATTGSNTFIGNQIISGNVNITGSLTASGLAYPTTAGTAGQFMTTNGTNTLSFDDVHVLLEDVRYGENITIGDPLYVSGSNGIRPVVYKADASNSAKMPVIYVANSTNVANTNTTALTLGLITGVTTTGYTEGTTIYVAEGGGWSASRPSGSASIVQSLGIVTKTGSGGSGRGLVLNPGPATLPNLQTGYIWAGNGNNQPVAVSTGSFITESETGSFATTASFNSYTSSNDQRVTSLETNSGSVNVSISNINTTTASLNTSVNALNVFTASQSTASLVTSIDNLNTFSASALVSISNINTTTASLLVETQNLELFSASALISISNLNASSASQQVSIDNLNQKTGSYATTGSNTFIGNETFQDAGGNASTLVPTSGSLMLVAKSFTSASLHLSASTSTSVNLIFKNSDVTADTIISGSNNIFTNPAAITAGFKRYIGGNQNIAMNASAVPQISGSMGFSPAMSNNYFGGTAGMIFRGPVSSSAWSINNNLLNNTTAFSIGSAAATNAEKMVSGCNMTNNLGNVFIRVQAYKTPLSASFTYSTNTGAGVVDLNLHSSSINYNGNVSYGGTTINNLYFPTSVDATSGLVSVASCQFMGGTNIVFSGSNASMTGQTRTLYGSLMFGFTSASLVLNGDSGSLMATSILGAGLSVTGSNSRFTTSNIPNNDHGSVFVGRYNDQSGNKALSAQTVFAVGTGTANATANRKTGFLVDSGSNTFIEGTLNVSGSLSFTGSTYGNVVALSVASNTASIDLSAGNYFTLTLPTSATTNLNLTNVTPGVTATLVLTTDTASSSSFSYNVKQPSGSLYYPSNSGSTDIITFVAVNSTTINAVSVLKMI